MAVEEAEQGGGIAGGFGDVKGALVGCAICELEGEVEAAGE